MQWEAEACERISPPGVPPPLPLPLWPLSPLPPLAPSLNHKMPYQTSSFGAFLDVAVDLATRGTVWSWAAPGGLGAAVLLLEAVTFTCTHAVCDPKGGGEPGMETYPDTTSSP